MECLQRASQQPDMLDALMLCERYFGQGISSWFMRTVSAFRVRPALESKISWSRILDDDGHSAEMLTDSRCTVWKRILFIFPFVAIAIPYPYFVYIVPGLISENEAASFSILFLTVISSTPVADWIMYMLMVVRNQNKDTMDRLQLLQLSRLQKRSARAQQSTTRVAVGYARGNSDASLLGKNGLKLQKETNERRWKTLAIVGFVWNCVLWLSYVTWIGSVVFTETCQSGTRGICFLWVVLLFSSFIRFSVPVSIVMRFLVVCDVVMDKIDMWFELHRASQH